MLKYPNISDNGKLFPHLVLKMQEGLVMGLQGLGKILIYEEGACLAEAVVMTE